MKGTFRRSTAGETRRRRDFPLAECIPVRILREITHSEEQECTWEWRARRDVEGIVGGLAGANRERKERMCMQGERELLIVLVDVSMPVPGRIWLDRDA